MKDLRTSYNRFLLLHFNYRKSKSTAPVTQMGQNSLPWCHSVTSLLTWVQRYSTIFREKVGQHVPSQHKCVLLSIHEAEPQTKSKCALKNCWAGLKYAEAPHPEHWGKYYYTKSHCWPVNTWTAFLTMNIIWEEQLPSKPLFLVHSKKYFFRP